MAADEPSRLIQIRRNLETRSRIFELVRRFFRERGFLEVETPIRTPAIAPERYIVPFDSEGWYLATSPELYMKRLLAAGYEKIFQLSHCFRKGERGRRHNPEFSLLEWYVAGSNCDGMIADTEGLVLAVADGLGIGKSIIYQTQPVDLSKPWPLLSVRQAFQSAAGWDPVASYDECRFDEDMVSKVIPGLTSDRPCVLSGYPTAAAALARLTPSNPAVAERAEVFICGLELANAYSELTDPIEQRQRFEAEVDLIERDCSRRPAMPERFLEAVRQMPGCGGIALGLDRLAMLFTDSDSIDQVMPFTVDDA